MSGLYLECARCGQPRLNGSRYNDEYARLYREPHKEKDPIAAQMRYLVVITTIPVSSEVVASINYGYPHNISQESVNWSVR